MHTQISTVIRTLQQDSRRVSFDLSADEQSPLGQLLFCIYYRSSLVDLASDQISGYPHNGGRHTLRWRGTPADAAAWLDLASDEWSGRFGATDPRGQIAAQLRSVSKLIRAQM